MKPTTSRIALALLVLAACSAGAAPEAAPVDSSPAELVQATTAGGNTPTSFQVSSTGSATFTIPIFTSPGVGAIHPNLELHYDSNAGNGPFGVGWGLSGLSMITRCPRTVASDGVAGPILWSTADRLCMDGTRLELVTGTYGADGSTYATERETFARVELLGGTFRVTTKDGLIHTYGGNGGVQPTTAPFRTWMLSRTEDRTGNAIEYAYAESTGLPRLTNITYPKTATGQGPFTKVTFTYEARPDVVSGYTAGAPTSESRRVSKITVATASGTPVRSYGMTYGQGATTGRSQLQAIQECSATTCLPATTITYQQGTTGWAAAVRGPATGNASPNGCGNLTGDFDGDGRLDFIWSWFSSIDGAGGAVCKWAMRRFTGDAFAADVAVPKETYFFGPQTPPRMIAGSFTGVSRTQFLMTVGAETMWTLVDFNATSNTFVTTATTLSTSNGALLSATDVDGDGLSDLVFSKSGSIVVRKNTTTPGGALQFGAAVTIMSGFPTDTPPNGVDVQDADFNGDGLHDLAVTTPWSPGRLVTLYLSRPQIGTWLPDAMLHEPTSERIGIRTLNWNGDHCADVLFGDQVWPSNCLGGLGSPVTLPKKFTVAGEHAVIADVDGDGRDDIVYRDTQTHEVDFIRSLGTSAAAPQDTGLAIPSGCDLATADANDDALADVLAFCPDEPSPRVYLHLGTSPPADVAETFTDGFRIKHAVVYGPVTDAAVYTPSSTATYPEQDAVPALHVVKTVTTSDGNGGTYPLSYRYAQARVDARGRGFEGFGRRETTDGRNGLVQIDEYGQAFPYTGMLLRRTSKQPNAGPAITTWTGTPGQQVFGSGTEKRYFTFVATETTTSAEVGGSKDGAAVAKQTVTRTYGDGWGNPTKVVTTKTDLDTTAPASPFAGQSWSSTIVTTYLNEASSWCLGQATSTTLTSTAPGQQTQVRKQTATVDAQACRVTQTVDEPATPALSTTTDFGYDFCGNRSSMTVTGHEPDGTVMPSRTTTFDYGTRCQLPERFTNALQQSERTTWDYTVGVAVSHSDANGIATTWDLDDYGRVVKETRADGTYSNVAYTGCNATSCWGDPDLRLLVRTTDYANDAATVVARQVFRDGYGRDRLSKSTHAFGRWVTDARVEYDALGRVTFSANPYSATDNGGTSSTYDLLDRVKTRTEVRPDVAATTTVDYLGRTARVKNARGYTTTKVTDVTNRLRRVTEPSPGGTSSYDYDALGNLAHTRDAIGADSWFTSNVLGYRTSTTGADSGTTTYAVDSLGEVVGTKDAKLQSTTTNYDRLGRLTKRTEPEGVSTWTWGSSAAAHEIGRLRSVTGYGGAYAEVRGYDAIGRLAKRTITTDQAYAYDYTYGADGEIDVVTYPTSPAPTPARFALKHKYSSGTLSELMDVTGGGSRSLWKLNTESDWGAPTSETLGGAVPITTTTSFLPNTRFVNAIQAGTGTSTTSLQSLAYDWDAVGNLKSRRDVRRSLLEEFGYDALDRLTSSKLGGATNLTVTYDAAGDILTRSDFGTYTYGDVAHPHAATAANYNLVYSYDANGNMASKSDLLQDLAYPQYWTSFDLPSELRWNGASTKFTYGPDHERLQQVDSDGETISYIGDRLERVHPAAGGDEWRHIVPTPGGSWLIVTRSAAGTTTSSVLTDHLGSTHKVVSNDTGAVLVEESFAPFGARRRGNDWAALPTPADRAAFARTTHDGFTGHSHLDKVGFVHMGGRAYDPDLGRFMSVDSVAHPSRPQTLNPYSYVANGPLSETDPSGLDPEFDFDIDVDLPGAGGGSGSPSWNDFGNYSVNLVTYEYWLPTVEIIGTRISDDNPYDGMTGGAYIDPMGGVYTLTPLGQWGAAVTLGAAVGASTLLPIQAPPIPDVMKRDNPGLLWAGAGLGVGIGVGAWAVVRGPPVGWGVLTAAKVSVAVTAKGVQSALEGTAGGYVEGGFTAAATAVDGTVTQRTVMFASETAPRADTLKFTDIGLFDLRTATGIDPRSVVGMKDLVVMKDTICKFACASGFAKAELFYKRADQDIGGTSIHPGVEFRWLFDAASGRRLKLPQGTGSE
jgi:RHS repeat-associated protein